MLGSWGRASLPTSPTPASPPSSTTSPSRRSEGPPAGGQAPAGGRGHLALLPPSGAEQITAATYDEEGALLGECDLIIEVVVERLDIKHKVFDWVATHRKSGSRLEHLGLSVADMTSNMAPERERFLVMHFFNPVRYMRLLELVAGEDTLPEVGSGWRTSASDSWARGSSTARTPQLRRQPSGRLRHLSVFHHMDRLGMNPKEVDAVCGRPMGRLVNRSSAPGIVGLDTLAHTVKTMYEGCEGDEQRERFVIPDWLQVMLDEGALGEKSGRGFFKKIKRAGKSVILTRDLKTGEYVELEKPRFDSVKAAKKGGVKALVAGDDKAAQLAWSATVDSLLYAATRLPEIADDIVNIDRAMRWGFAWDRGPFEGWDDLGVAESVARMQGEGHEVPGWVLQMLEAGRESFYARDESGALTYWDHISASAQPIPTLHLAAAGRAEEAGGLKSDSASLYDLGDGVLGLRFHSR